MNPEDQPKGKLIVKYQAPDGTPAELVLGDKPITIGRSPDADIITLDERASRMHCGIRLWDGEYYIKDLKSKNGTYLNNERAEMAKIKPGDKIRLGNTVLTIMDKRTPGTATTMSNVENEMAEGKGYKTLLREIVSESEKPAPGAQADVPDEDTKVEEPKTKTAKLVAPPPERPEGAEKPAPVAGGPAGVKRKPTAIHIKRR